MAFFCQKKVMHGKIPTGDEVLSAIEQGSNMSEVMDLNDIELFHYPNELADYRHDGVIGKFKDEWDVDDREAQDIFEEMKKFLFVAEYAHRQCFDLEIDESLLMIDKMWHQFVLFTTDYERFCNRFFGKMLHHMPFCAAHLAQTIKNLAQKGITLAEFKQGRLGRQLSVIQEAFGLETVRKWYVEYANRYTPEKVNLLQRPVFHGQTKMGPPLDSVAAGKMSAAELTQGIIQQMSPSMYCGAGCGMYSTCNSRQHLY